MNLAEAAVALGVASGYDNRQPAEIAAQAWATALDDLNLETVIAGIHRHYRESTEFVKPAHIRALVRPEADRRPYNRTVVEALTDGYDCPHGDHRERCALCRRPPALSSGPRSGRAHGAAS